MTMMVELILLFFGALVIAVALTPVSRWLAPHIGIVAVPRARDVHTTPVPKMGGVAILLGTLLMSLVMGSWPEFQQLAAMCAGDRSAHSARRSRGPARLAAPPSAT